MRREKKCNCSHVTKEKEERNMAVLAKPINKITVVGNEDSHEFVREFNKNKVSKEFLDSCKKAGELFAKRKK